MRRRTMYLVLMAGAVAAFVQHAATAAKWGPTWSEVTSDLYPTARMHMTAAVISKVDGTSETDRIVKLEPGKHVLVVRSPMRKGFSGRDVTLHLDVEPCKRYYINAQFKHGTGPDWEPVVVMVEPVSGCKLPAAG